LPILEDVQRKRKGVEVKLWKVGLGRNFEGSLLHILPYVMPILSVGEEGSGNNIICRTWHEPWITPAS
jgi:hypothetical protein